MQETTDAHCGYEWPFSLWRLLPFHGGPRRHDFHHEKKCGCYGGFSWWDRWMGTDKAFLENEKKKQQKAN